MSEIKFNDNSFIYNFEHNIELNKNYSIILYEYIDEINAYAYYLEHNKTKSKIIYLNANDDEKVFSVGIKTPPEDSKGVAHVIEHCTFRGSKKYNAEDMYVELMKNTPITYLNAMTFPDRTVYFGACSDAKAFNAIIDRYIDGILYPNFYDNNNILLQEGCRCEKDEHNNTQVNGVVYNEMSDLFSNPDYYLSHSIRCSLFPDNSYYNEAGGMPDDIIHLTSEDIIKYHKKYYHPSNAFFYFYGNIDIESKLLYLDQKYLTNFKYKRIESDIKEQTSIKRNFEMGYPVSNTELIQCSYLSYNIVAADTSNIEECIALQAIMYILVSYPESILKKEIIENGIGTNIISNCDKSIKKLIISLIIKDAVQYKKDEFVRIINEKLNDVIKNGINKSVIKAVINRLVFKHKERSSTKIPLGVVYGLNILKYCIYNIYNPFVCLKLEQVYINLKENIETEYYNELIIKYLIQPTHHSILSLIPEKRCIEKKIIKCVGLNNLSTNNLKNFQTKKTFFKDDKFINDIRAMKDNYCSLNTEFQDILGVKLIYDTKQTNDIIYLNLLFNLEAIPDYLIPYIGVIKCLFGRVHTKKYALNELTSKILNCTGGLSNEICVLPKYNSNDKYYCAFSIKIKVTLCELDNIFDIIKEIILYSKYDNKETIYRMLYDTMNKLYFKITSNANSMLVNRALSYSSEIAEYNEKVQGIKFYNYLCILVKSFNIQQDEIIKNIYLCLKHIFSKDTLTIGCTINEENKDFCHYYLTEFINDLPSESTLKIPQGSLISKIYSEGFKTNNNMQHISKCCNFTNYGIKYSGKLRVISNIINYDYLWRESRLKGGTYGCTLNMTFNGDFYFVSQKDPNFIKTLELLNGIPEFLTNYNVNTEEINNVIKTIINKTYVNQNSINRYLFPHICGITEKMLQDEWDEVISVTIEEISTSSDILDYILSKSSLCVIGNKLFLDKNNSMFNELHII